MTQNKFFQSRTAIITLIAACAVVFISLGVRQTFGLFFMDFKKDLGISITNSGLAVGIQMLMWGLTGPIFGAIADKYGGHKAISLAFIFYILGFEYIGRRAPTTKCRNAKEWQELGGHCAEIYKNVSIVYMTPARDPKQGKYMDLDLILIRFDRFSIRMG